MTDQHDRLRELLEKATPGPWYEKHDGGIYTEAKEPGWDLVMEFMAIASDYDMTLIVEAINALPALLDEVGRECVWTLDSNQYEGDNWHSSCGQMWHFIEGDLVDNSVNFCHYCGGKVKTGGEDG